MGILNVTPDSSSDGGRFIDPGDAVRHGLEMADQGASVIDVGAESTRPGSAPVSAEEEMRRLRPVLRDLIPSLSVPVSVDTMKAEVAEMCISMGAQIINDVNGLRGPGMAEVCASSGVYAIIMHMPGSMGTVHAHDMGEGFAEQMRSSLRELTASAIEAGVRPDRLIMDPGIGFGKTMEQNMWILEHSSYFSDGFPVLSASSRKRVISAYFPDMDIDDASAEAACIAAESGADMVRVHDVARTAAAFESRFSRR